MKRSKKKRNLMSKTLSVVGVATIFLCIALYFISKIECNESSRGIIAFLIPMIELFKNITSENKGDYIGIISMQISVVFLTTGLISLLSDKNDNIYWENLIERELINPKVLSFLALSSYGYAGVVVSIFCYCIKYGLGLLLGTFICVLSMVVLFYKMAIIHFNKEGIEKKIVKDFEKASDSGKKEYLKELLDKTIAAIGSNDYSVARKNAEFLIDSCVANDEVDESFKQLFDRIPNNHQVFYSEVLEITLKNQKLISLIDEEVCESVSRNLEKAIRMNDCSSILLKNSLNIIQFRHRMLIQNFLKEYGESVLYAANSSNVNAEKNAESKCREAQVKIKRINKRTNLFRVAYDANEIYVVDRMIEFFFEMSMIEEEYYKKVCEGYGYNYYDIACNIDFVYVLNEANKNILKNILKQDEKQNVLTDKQKRELKFIIDEKEDYEPSDEEIENQMY